ncbi:hypothetical protein VB796_18115 [Arcicella sp. LKC2W]|uniref:hypothetical protein n=1 Tax=Arcicella sp. LKC2W TaxID=2984198 RepID=UPI002B21A347|nr:hypothetical protein [Arcicella sp. LKC2W]MEA5460982.1 hypothetical protein [Arcicella sp. LKC2W]
MNISSLKKTLTGLALLSILFNTQAQEVKEVTKEVKSEPIFGSVLERKIVKDSSKKHTPFNPLKPAFFRVGVLGGSLIAFDNSSNDKVGGTMGLRIEYGFSNRISLVADFQGNRTNNSTFSRGQSSLGVNWMPFKSRRLQPYFGAGVGVGRDGNGFGRYDDRRGGSRPFDNDYNRRGVQGFAYARTGLNYVLAKKLLAIGEASYQVPFNNSTSNGGVALRVGLAYQFGKNKK